MKKFKKVSRTAHIFLVNILNIIVLRTALRKNPKLTANSSDVGERSISFYSESHESWLCISIRKVGISQGRTRSWLTMRGIPISV